MSFIKREGSFWRRQADDGLRVGRGASVNFQFGKNFMSAKREVLTLVHGDSRVREIYIPFKLRQDLRPARDLDLK